MKAKLHYKKEARVTITKNGLHWRTAIGNDRGQISNRICFDFFDTAGIIIQVGNKNDIWFFGISMLFEKRDTYTSRTEAETASFTKAFSILEERLSK